MLCKALLQLYHGAPDERPGAAQLICYFFLVRLVLCHIIRKVIFISDKSILSPQQALSP